MNISGPPSRFLGRIGSTRSSRAKVRANGGVVRRKFADVEAGVGRDALELAVRRRGFHLIECDRDFCNHLFVRSSVCLLIQSLRRRLFASAIFLEKSDRTLSHLT
jgi:hypothetical protein